MGDRRYFPPDIAMSLTKEQVMSIGFDIAKQKYYNAHKVDAVLDELKVQVAALIDEADALRAQCAALKAENEELSAKTQGMKTIAEAEAIKAAADKLAADTRAQSDDFMEKTKQFAAQIVADASKRADEMISSAKSKAAMLSPVKADGHTGGALSEEQLDAITDINKQLEELSVTQATQIMRIKQAIMLMATEM